jgi:methylthioribose-1-phosphate isomerase
VKAPSILVFASLSVSLACVESTVEQTSCRGLSEKTVGITGEEFRPCATEIMAALDTLQRQLRHMSQGDSTARPQARETSRRLSRLIRQVDAKEPAAIAKLRWSEEATRSFYSYARVAAQNYSGTLKRWDDGSFREGSRLHAKARSSYQQIQ